MGVRMTFTISGIEEIKGDKMKEAKEVSATEPVEAEKEPTNLPQEIKKKQQEIEDLKKKAMAEEEALEEVDIKKHIHCEVCKRPFWVEDHRVKQINRCYKCR